MLSKAKTVSRSKHKYLSEKIKLSQLRGVFNLSVPALLNTLNFWTPYNVYSAEVYRIRDDKPGEQRCLPEPQVTS